MVKLKTKRSITKSKSGHYTATLSCSSMLLFKAIKLSSKETAQNLLKIAEESIKENAAIHSGDFAYNVLIMHNHVNYCVDKAKHASI